jgi:hypothetical protein
MNIPATIQRVRRSHIKFDTIFGQLGQGTMIGLGVVFVLAALVASLSLPVLLIQFVWNSFIHVAFGLPVLGFVSSIGLTVLLLLVVLITLALKESK